MNDSTASPGGPHEGPVHDAGQGAGPASNSFFRWLRSLNIVRAPQGRWFAGVASGIAQRLNVDALLIRGAFIVLAVLGGPGLLLYLFGWLFLPDHTGKIHVEELMRGRSTPGVTIAAIVVAVWVMAGFFFGNVSSLWAWNLWDNFGFPHWLSTTFAWFFWLAIIAVSIIVVQQLIVRHGRSQRDGGSAGASPSSPPSGEQPASAEPGASASHSQGFTGAEQPAAFAEQVSAWGQQAGAKAQSWGQETGAKAQEWGQQISEKADSWSAKYAAEYDRTKMPMGQALITLALAMLAAGGASVWALESSVAESLSHAWGASGALVAGILAATIVLAVSIIIAGVRGRHSGGIGFLGFLGVVALLVTAVLPWGARYFFIGDNEVGADSPAVVAFVGRTEVDLSDLERSRTAESLTVTQLVGNVDLELPASRPVTVHARVLAGQVREERAGGSEQTLSSGVLSQRELTFNERGRGAPLEITVNIGTGNLYVVQPDAVEESR